MSRKLTCLAVCLFLVLGISNDAESATMVAHWRFDDDATDSAGDIDGTLMSGADFKRRRCAGDCISRRSEHSND